MNAISRPAISPPERARAARLCRLAPGLALLLGACSWLPFVGGDTGPHLTNPAVQACEDKASALGYDGVAEHETTPGKDGSYTVVLDVLRHEGYGQVSCSFDPAKGAQLPPPPAAPK